MWKLHCCILWLIVLLSYYIFIASICSAVYFLLHRQLSTCGSKYATPKLVSGISDTVVNLGGNLKFAVSATVTVNCSGSIFVMEDTDCNVLNETKTSVVHSLDLFNPSVWHLLEGSSLTVWYKDRGDRDIGNCFAVVRSLDGYNKYLELKKECDGSERDVIKKVCFDQDSAFVPDPNATEGYFECIQLQEFIVHTYHVKNTEFYYFSIPITFPVQKDLNIISYNRSLFHEIGFIEHSLELKRDGNYSVTFPVPGNIFSRAESCIILSTTCPINRFVSRVNFKFECMGTLYHSLSVGAGIFILLGLGLITGCCCCSHRAKEKNKEDKEVVV